VNHLGGKKTGKKLRLSLKHNGKTTTVLVSTNVRRRAVPEIQKTRENGKKGTKPVVIGNGWWVEKRKGRKFEERHRKKSRFPGEKEVWLPGLGWKGDPSVERHRKGQRGKYEASWQGGS